MATKTSVSNQGLLDPAAQSSIPDWMKDLQSYQTPNVSVPNLNFKTPSADEIVSQANEANIAAAPSLEKISDIINQINTKQYLARPGAQQALDAINQRVAGYVSPETIAENQLAAAQTYGGGGFGVDSPAWQSAIRRAIGIDRERLIGEGLGEYKDFIAGFTPTNAKDFALTASDYATAQANAERNRIAAAELAQRGSISQAELGQQAALERAKLGQALQAQQQQYAVEQAKLAEEQRAALQREAISRQQLEQEYELTPAKAAELYARVAGDPWASGRWSQFAGFGPVGETGVRISGPLGVGLGSAGLYGYT